MKNNAIIITGANGNVGSYFAKKYYELGENLILIVHKSEHRTKNLVKDHSDKIKVIQIDLSDYSNLKIKLARVIAKTGWKPDRLIHTATARSHAIKSLSDSDPELWKNIINVNLVGTFNILKTTLKYFKENSNGKIVLFGSNVSRIGLPKGTAYAASKAGIANIGRTLATEEAANNIIINTVSPGPIKIDDSQFSESYRKFRQEYYEEKLRETPLKRCASFQDIFGLCEFLLSKDNSYITGEEFFITGGKI
ncbi:MAG: SDR family oxidoreductase [Candidatus Tenebribacter burtonii]|jgi:NAD(P)-dependent dehydrogenase (short-subunit alcohol dehydrogenase family)|nr:SDR family oxidoreductase [Candidatus Tenebribacter burtonii]